MRISLLEFNAHALTRAQRSFQKFAAVFLLISVALVGAATSANAQSYRFTTVVIEGNSVIDDNTIAGYARIARNRSMSAGELNAAYQRVSGTGFFRSVDFVPSGSRLVIRVEEYPIVNRVAFEGNRRIKDDDLAELVALRSGVVYSPARAEADANTIAEAYAERGRLSARVTPRLIERAGGRVDVAFEIAEGRVVQVERISFVGNRSFSERRLRNAVDSAQAGRLSALFRADNYNDARVARDRQTLQDFYLSRGYVDAQVLSGVTELSRERDGAYVTFTIREGQQYRIGTVTVVSEINGVDAEPYQAALTDRTGQLFTPTQVESLVQQAERVGYESGRRFVRAEPRMTRDERNSVINVELALVRGDRVFIERIDIQGNATTQDRVIRRQFDVAEGDPLNPREIREAAARIQGLGYFSDVQVNPTPGSSPTQAVVDVQVEETTTGSLGFGVSYGGGAFGGNINYSENNFLGRGQRLGVSLSATSDSRSMSIDFTEPALMGRDLALGLSLGLNTTTSNADARFNTEVLQFSPSLTFPVSEYGRLQTRATFSRDQITNVDVAASPRIQQDAALGRQFTSSIGFTYTYDTRDNGPDPDRGFVFRFATDAAGIGGDRRWVRSTVMAGYERQIMDGDVTLRAEVEAGGVVHSSGASRINERFNLSSAQMRGFRSYGIGPRDSVTGDGLGGNFFAVARLEAEFPLGLPAEYNMRGGVFLDVGSLWGVDNPTANVVDSRSMRAVAGVSLFWGSPFGPLRFNFAAPIQTETYDRVRRFDLTLATRF